MTIRLSHYLVLVFALAVSMTSLLIAKINLTTMTYDCLFTGHHHNSQEEADICKDQHRDLGELPFNFYKLQSKGHSNVPHGVSLNERTRRI